MCMLITQPELWIQLPERRHTVVWSTSRWPDDSLAVPGAAVINVACAQIARRVRDIRERRPGTGLVAVTHVPLESSGPVRDRIDVLIAPAFVEPPRQDTRRPSRDRPSRTALPLPCLLTAGWPEVRAARR